MSYIPHTRRHDVFMSSQGDGTGVTDMGVDGKSITAATTASPVVCTSNAHGYVTGDWIFIDGGTGITEINGLRRVIYVSDNTFSLLDGNLDAINSAGTYGGSPDSNIALVCRPAAGQIYTLALLNGAMADASVALDGLGGVTRLTNGLIFAVYRGASVQQSLATVKGWNDWSLYTGGSDMVLSDIAGNKLEWGMKWTFNRIVEGGSHHSDVRLVGDSNDMLAIYTQDDLAALVSLRFLSQGYNA